MHIITEEKVIFELVKDLLFEHAGIEYNEPKTIQIGLREWNFLLLENPERMAIFTNEITLRRPALVANPQTGV